MSSELYAVQVLGPWLLSCDENTDIQAHQTAKKKHRKRDTDVIFTKSYELAIK
jgi:hypothetical protein